MKITNTGLKGCFIVEPTVFGDERGYFFEGFNKVKLKELTDVDFDPKQLNQSSSSYGVLRGLHFQKNPKAQAKLVSCSEGEILDIAVDVRKGSKTYGQYFSVKLSDENKKSLFIPKGMAHGFLVLSKKAKLMYLVDEVYSPKHDTGIIYNDSDLNIPWGLAQDEIILSTKDQNLPTFKEFELNF